MKQQPIEPTLQCIRKLVKSKYFVANKPNQVRTLDFTYLHKKEDWLYLASIIDLYNNEIIIYETSRKNSLKLV
ncbi:TPA: DDE-type integrase/transposase/recombinase [Bacillus cereus]